MIIILSGSTKEYKILLELTGPNKAQYSSKYGHYYKELEFPDNNNVESGPYILDALNKYPEFPWCWWADSDILITNYLINIEDLCDNNYDVIGNIDWYGFNNGSVLYKNTENTKKLIQLSLDIRKEDHDKYLELANSFWPKSHQGHDKNTNQTAMLSAMALLTKENKLKVKWIDQRLINSYKLDEYKNYPTCIKTNRFAGDKSSWQQGDFVLHLPAIPNSRRIEIFKDFIANKITK